MSPSVQSLSQLLLSLFSPFELRAFLLEGPSGEEIVASLPDGPPTEQAFAAVLALRRRGLVDAAWFEDLARVRPNRRVEILGVGAPWSAAARGDLGVTASRSGRQVKVIVDGGGVPSQADLVGDSTVSMANGALLVHVSALGEHLRVRIVGPTDAQHRPVILQIGEQVYELTLQHHSQSSGVLGGEDLLLDHRVMWSKP